MDRRFLIVEAEFQETRRQVEDQVLGLVEPEPWTVQRFVEEVWAAKYAETNRSKNASSVAMSRYATYIDPIIGGLEPSEVVVDDVDRVYAYVQSVRLPSGRGLALATQRQIMLLVKSVLRRMQIRGLIAQSPFFHEEHLPKLKQNVPRPLTADQIEAILKPGALTESWHLAAVLLGLSTGFRKSDMLALRWSHVDRVNNRVGPILGKGGKVRYVPLNEQLSSALDWWRTSGGGLGFLGPDGVSDYVLPTRSGDSFKWVERSSKSGRKKAARVGFRWNLHQTRHTFACAYLDGGGRLKALSQILGHSSVKTTEIYTTISIGELVREGVSVMNKALANMPTCPHTCPHEETEEGGLNRGIV